MNGRVGQDLDKRVGLVIMGEVYQMTRHKMRATIAVTRADE